MSKIKDITGQKFGKLTAIKFIKRDKHSNQVWLWKCDCGNEKEAKLMNVKHTTVSCGCYAKEQKYYEDVTGQRFGNCIAIKPVRQDKKGRYIWQFECDCGKFFNKKISDIKRYYHKSCGCTIQIGTSIKSILHSYKQSAIKRNLEFLLTDEEFIKLTQEKCYYCGNNGDSKARFDDPISYCGIDRINNEIYI